MEGIDRYCEVCGHRCHCYKPNCEESIGVGMSDKYQLCNCTSCECHNVLRDSMIPDSFTKRN